MHKSFLVLISLMIAGVLATPAQAAREPTQEERAKVEQFLKEQGYVSWEEIEFDDGMWEIDNAKAKDGTVYDINLEPVTFRVVEMGIDRGLLMEKRPTTREQQQQQQQQR